MQEYQSTTTVVTTENLFATKFDGDYDHIEQAAEANLAGSAKSFEFKEDGKVLTFTDANGNKATITEGDYLKVSTGADGACNGYLAVPAAVGDAWVTPPPAQLPATEPAAEAPATAP